MTNPDAPALPPQPDIRRDLARLLDNLYGLAFRPGHLNAVLDVVNLHAPVKTVVSAPALPAVEALKQLVVKWRAKTGGKLVSGDDHWDGQRSGIHQCADELEAVIATSLPAVEAQTEDEQVLCDSLRYARGLIRKAHRSGASFVEINVSTLAYLVENRRKLNDRVRWAEQRASAAEAKSRDAIPSPPVAVNLRDLLMSALSMASVDTIVACVKALKAEQEAEHVD